MHAENGDYNETTGDQPRKNRKGLRLGFALSALFFIGISFYIVHSITKTLPSLVQASSHQAGQIQDTARIRTELESLNQQLGVLEGEFVSLASNTSLKDAAGQVDELSATIAGMQEQIVALEKTVLDDISLTRVQEIGKTVESVRANYSSDLSAIATGLQREKQAFTALILVIASLAVALFGFAISR